ncbi:MAG: hypothetical protein ABSD57_02165 [Verrucomicrobiota bacterium]|jgi:hypothetical protein
MSRINDALKRAKQAQRPTPPPSLPPLPPAAPRPDPPQMPRAARQPGNVLGWLLPGVIGFLIVAACLFVGLVLVTRTATKAAGEAKPLAAQPAKPVVVPAPNPTPQTPPAPPPPPPPSPPSPPPEPKLQGIVYTATRSWAIVDGKTVHVGDRLGEFRVKEISQRNVTLEKADGSQKKLGLDK